MEFVGGGGGGEGTVFYNKLSFPVCRQVIGPVEQPV